MNRPTINAVVARLRRCIKFFTIFAALLFAAFVLPASAQTNSWLFENHDPLDKLLAPQASRPDILWMRGGHSTGSIGISRSANGQILATVAGDSTVKIWNSADDKLMRTINQNANSIGLSPDGQTIAVGSGRDIKIYGVSNGILLLTIPTVVSQYQVVGGVAISSNNQFVASVAGNGDEGKMFRVSDGVSVHDFGLRADGSFGYGSVAFSPDSQLIAMGHTSGNPKIFNVLTGNLVRTVANNGFLSLTFSPDGQYLAGASGIGPQVFRVSDGSVVGLASNASTPWGSTVSFSPNGQYLAGGIESVNVKMWQVASGSPWSLINQFQAEPVTDASNVARVNFNAANQLITTHSSIKVWNPANNSFLRNISQFSGALRALAFTADGQKVAVSNLGNLTNSLRLLNSSNGLPIVDFPQSNGLGISQLAITPDGQRIVTIDGFDNRYFVKIWNAVDGSLIRNTEMSGGGYLTVAAPDNQSYILAGHTSGGSFPATQYRISNGTIVRTFGSNDCIQRVLDISPDGSTIAVNKPQCSYGENTGLWFYRISDGTVLRRIINPLPDGYGYNASIQNGVFSPDGQNFAISVEYNFSINPKPAYLLRISDGARIREFVGHQASSDGIAFTPDGLNLATTSWDNTVRFWRVSDGALLNTFDEETLFTDTDSLSSNIKFSPDGSRFVYARRDATVVMARNPYSSGGCAPNLAGLVGCYRAEGNADDLALGNNGVFSNPSFASGRDVGQAFNFNGGNYVSVPNASANSYGANASMSVSLWVYRTGNGAQHLFGKRDGCYYGGTNYQMVFDNGTLYFGSIPGYATSNDNPLPLNVWTHVAGTSDGTTLRLYINGVLKGSVNAPLGPENTAPFYIGTAGSCQTFVGKLDDLQIYNRALSESDVQSVFNAANQTYTISGQITDGVNPVAGIKVVVSGSRNAFTTTDAVGNFSFGNLPTNGDYTVTADKCGYTFNPPSRSFTNLTQNQTANFTAATGVCPTQPNGINSWWRANNNAIDSIGDDHGVLVGNATYAAGKLDQSFSFDGNGDSVNVPSSAKNSFAANAPMSVALWAYRTNADDRIHIVGKRDGCGDDSYNYQMGIHAGIGAGLYFGSRNALAGSVNDPVPVNQWVLLTGTFDGSTFRIYMNGALLGSQNGSMGPENGAPFKIGTSGTCADRNEGWRGRLDEVRLFNRALSQTEIQNIYNAEITNYTINGQITRGGTALGNVSVALSGSSTNSMTTDSNGNYSFTVNEGGSYTVTPTLGGNNFTPASQTFNFIAQNQTANFTAQLITYTISGNVKADGANLQGATVSLSGGQSVATTTDGNGNYTFTVPAGANYTVNVYKNGVNFNPASQTFTNLQANQIANFQNGASYCAPAPSGLAAFYKGENNVVDLVNFNVGSMVNGATFADGKSGRAFSLNGSGNYVQISDNTSISITGQITIQAWIKPNNVTPSQEVINKYEGTNNQRSFFLGLAGGNLTFWVSQTGAGSNFRSASTTNSPIAAGVFSQVTVTFNPTNQEMKIFVNGIDTNAGIVGGSTTINSILDSTAPLRFGTISGQDGFFGGLIDEVQLYNRVLSASEIAAIYNSGSAGVCSQSQIPAANGKIVFDSDRDSTGRRHLFTMNSDGTNVTQLTTGSGYNYYQASYSADGSRLVYTRYDYNLGTYDILRMDANGAQTNLTNDSFVDGSPAFSPDGGKIVYHSYQSNNYDIFVMNTDGSNRVKLTSSVGNRYPAFSPDGSKIAFLSQRNGNQEIYIMNADGSNQTRLTNTPSGEDDAPSFSPDGTKIYFNSQRDGNSEIYVMNADGSNQTRLTNNTVGDYASSIAPDGLKIIFTSNRDGNEEIYTMNANGTNQTRVTTNAASDTEASWQPVRLQTYTPISTNGKIAFVTSRTGNNEIYVMNADGSNQTNVSNNAANDDEAAWSPDGGKIAFTSDRNSNYEIYVMNPDGTNQIRLTNDANADTVPSWSPDGTKIVFYSNRSGNGDIYIMNADGSNQTRLTTNTAFDYVPKFSPDGSKIVFSSTRDGNDEIYIMNTDGSNQTRLTNNSAIDQSPAFSPDGSKIAFTSNRVGSYEVFVMNTDGSNPVNLSNNSAVDVRPAWSPDGTKIAFESFRDGNYEIYVMNADGTNPTRLTNNSASDYYPAWQPIRANISVAPASNVNLTFANVSQSGNTVATLIAPASAGALPSGYQLVSQSIAYDIRTSATYSGSLTTTISVPNVSDSATCSSLRLLHYETSANGLLNVTTGANAYNSATQICTVSGITTSLSPFVVAQFLAPTASGVSIGGRVITPNDLGLRGALVTLTDSHGTAQTTITGKGGAFIFRDVAPNEAYILTVSSKQYTYAPQVVTPIENLVGISLSPQ